jgi:hypothetical protein
MTLNELKPQMVCAVPHKAAEQVHAVTRWGGKREFDRLMALSRKTGILMVVRPGRFHGTHIRVGDEKVWLNIHHSRVEKWL